MHLVALCLRIVGMWRAERIIERDFNPDPGEQNLHAQRDREGICSLG